MNESIERRGWLLAPAAWLYAIDVTLTLAGQPAAYWAGDSSTVVEANPLAYVLLSLGPRWFIALAIGWGLAFSLVVFLARLRPATWLAVGLAAAHAIGGSSWLTRIGPWGLAVAVAYIAAASQASAWSWRKSEPRGLENG